MGVVLNNVEVAGVVSDNCVVDHEAASHIQAAAASTTTALAQCQLLLIVADNLPLARNGGAVGLLKIDAPQLRPLGRLELNVVICLRD